MAEMRPPTRETDWLKTEAQERAAQQPRRLRRAKRAAVALVALAILLGLLNASAALWWHWPPALTEFIGSYIIRNVWYAAIAVSAWAGGYNAGHRDRQRAEAGEESRG